MNGGPAYSLQGVFLLHSLTHSIIKSEGVCVIINKSLDCELLMINKKEYSLMLKKNNY
jgi:hypothetical protein